MYSIVYVSTAQPELSEKELQKIFDFSEKNNNARSITGILIYHDGNFFQVLESEENDKELIIDLFERIKKDPRHYDVIKIMSKETRSKAFSKYHSSFTTMINPANVSELYSFLKQEEEINPEGYKEIAYLTQKFLALI